MKKQLLFITGLLLLSLTGFCQNQLNLVIFSEDGDLFYAYINGVKQNDKPEANVKIAGMTNPNISLRIEFADKVLPQLKQNMALELGFEHTAKIKRDMKKLLKLRYVGQTPLDNSTTTNVSTVHYHTAENPEPNTTTGTSGSGNTIITTTTTEITNNSTPGTGSININMGVAGISMNMGGMDPNTSSMNSTTSTTVTSSSSSSANYDNTSNASNGTASSSTNPKAACSSPMNSDSFAKMKQSIEAKPFSDTKMSTAKIAAKNSCLSVSQVKEVCKLFNMDDEKLVYAKYAYDYTVDKANYYQVSDVFSFSGTTEELNKYLEEH